VLLDGYLRYRGSFYRTPEALVHQRVTLHDDRDCVWFCHRGQEVARYPRSYEPGSWSPAPRLRPEPPPAAAPARISPPQVAPPELSDTRRWSAKAKQAPVGERLPYPLGKLKAPRVLERLGQAATRTRQEEWPYEQFLEALLEAEAFARDASGARQRVRHAAFPQQKTLEDFD
jgi:IstB-like ATP binding protein/Mu transposase, C-terminal domain